MSVRSIDLLSEKESRKLASQSIDLKFYRMGIASGALMLALMSVLVLI